MRSGSAAAGGALRSRAAPRAEGAKRRRALPSPPRSGPRWRADGQPRASRGAPSCRRSPFPPLRACLRRRARPLRAASNAFSNRAMSSSRGNGRAASASRSATGGSRRASPSASRRVSSARSSPSLSALRARSAILPSAAKVSARRGGIDDCPPRLPLPPHRLDGSPLARQAKRLRLGVGQHLTPLGDQRARGGERGGGRPARVLERSRIGKAERSRMALQRLGVVIGLRLDPRQIALLVGVSSARPEQLFDRRRLGQRSLVDRKPGGALDAPALLDARALDRLACGDALLKRRGEGLRLPRREGREIVGTPVRRRSASAMSLSAGAARLVARSEPARLRLPAVRSASPQLLAQRLDVAVEPRATRRPSVPSSRSPCAPPNAARAPGRKADGPPSDRRRFRPPSSRRVRRSRRLRRPDAASSRVAPTSPSARASPRRPPSNAESRPTNGGRRPRRPPPA